jgi:hypothetical protein
LITPSPKIQHSSGRTGKDLFFGCALGKAGDGRNDFSFEISTRRSEVERKLLKGHGKRRPGTDAVST